MRRTVAILILALTACSTPSATSGPPGATAGGPTEGGGATTNPGGATTGPSSGATVRLVNVWAEPTKLGPSVELRVFNGATVLSAAPGEVSAFVAIPKAEFGEGPASLEAVRSGAAATESGIGAGQIKDGDRVTVIVHGEAGAEGIQMRVEPVWEVGEPGLGLPWPSMAPTDATLSVYPGPLLALPQDESIVNIRTKDGACLLSTLFGDKQTGGFGGTGATFLVLPVGTTTIDLGSKGAPDCTKIDADMGSVTITAAAGQRFGLIPWGMSGDIKLLQLDLSPG
jgi:hypothetical protein